MNEPFIDNSNDAGNTYGTRTVAVDRLLNIRSTRNFNYFFQIDVSVLTQAFPIVILLSVCIFLGS